jgi:glutathione S-transferase
MRTLYVLDGCPYALRTEIALREKGLEYRRAAVERGKPPPEVLAVSPGGVTPVLYDDNGAKLRDSAVICEYLDEQYPSLPLMPQAPAERAGLRLLLADIAGAADASGGLVRAVLKKAGPEAVAQAQAEWDEAVADWEEVLARGPWLAGERFGLADLLLYPLLASVRRLGGRPVPEGKARLAAWLERMEARPSVQAALGRAA